MVKLILSFLKLLLPISLITTEVSNARLLSLSKKININKQPTSDIPLSLDDSAAAAGLPPTEGAPPPAKEARVDVTEGTGTEAAGSIPFLSSSNKSKRLGRAKFKAIPEIPQLVPSNPPTDLSNEIPRARVYLHSLLNCAGSSKMFTSSATSFYEDFQPYVRNLRSVALCGRTTLWFYHSWDLDQRSILSGINRCPSDTKDYSKDPDDCSCYDLPAMEGNLVESIGLNYC